jgi:hypothetical protein
MPTEIIIKHSAGAGAVATEIRTLFCRESADMNPPDRNPLVETRFNELLDRIAQEAFNEGRLFEKVKGKHLA